MRKGIILILILGLAIISVSSAQLRRLEQGTENKFPKVPLASKQPVTTQAPYNSFTTEKSRSDANTLAKVNGLTGQFWLTGEEDENETITSVLFKSKNIYIVADELKAVATVNFPKDDVFFNSAANFKVTLKILDGSNRIVKEQIFSLTKNDLIKETHEFALTADKLSSGHYIAQVIFTVECSPGAIFAIGGGSIPPGGWKDASSADGVKLVKIDLVPQQK
jgi:hypothetical protein